VHDKYEIFGQRWIGTGDPQMPEIVPEGWIRLLPTVSLTASDWQSARDIQERFLRSLEQGSGPELREESATLRAVEQSERQSSRQKKRKLARIYHHDAGYYEIRVYRWHPGRGGGWVNLDYGTAIYADTLEEARVAVAQELAV